MPFSFLKKIRFAFRERSAQRQAWNISSSASGRQLSAFQAAALDAIRHELGELAFCEEGERDMFLVARRSDLNVYVYRDGAALEAGSSNHRFERWDYDSPEELIEAFVRSARDIENI